MSENFVLYKNKKYKVKNNSLDLAGRNIDNIDEIIGLNNLIKLQELDLYGNNITEIRGLESLTNLKILNLGWNNIFEIKGLEKLSNLTHLGLYNCKIEEIKGLEKLTKLKYLHLYENYISEINGLENLSELEELLLYNNPLIEKEKKYSTFFCKRKNLIDKIRIFLRIYKDINKVLEFSQKKSKFFENIKKILEKEFEIQRTLTSSEIRALLNINVEDSIHFHKMLNSQIEYSEDEIPYLKVKAEEIQLIQPTLFDLVIKYNYYLTTAKKIGQYLLDINYIEEFLRFPTNNLTLNINQKPKFEVKIPQIPIEVANKVPNELHNIIYNINNSIKQEFYGYCAILCRKLVESAIFIKLRNENKINLIQKGKNNYYSLEKRFDILCNNHFISNQRVRQLKIVKNFGDDAAHNFRIQIIPHQILSIMPIIMLFLQDLFDIS